MDCFEWLTRSSDFLDGTLTSIKKQEADTHLDSCPECSEHYKHFRLILTSIASQPRSSLPIAVRKSPFASALPRLDISLNRSRWERIPWYLRTTLEATGIVLLALGGVSLGPKIRALYEQKVEKNLNDFSQAFTDSSHPDTSQQLAIASQSRAGPANLVKTSDDFASEGEEEDISSTGDKDPSLESAETDEAPDIKVGNSDIWRFILRTDSPQDVRPKISSMLKSILPISNHQTRSPRDSNSHAANEDSSLDSDKVEGINAPGGIQFDLLVPQSAVAKLKKQLHEIAPPPPDGLADTPAGETFTWYKIKSKRKIPAGKARVVIWISQI